MEENSKKEFENYVASVKTKSEDLIKNQFPAKIEELNKLLDSEQFSFDHQQKVLYEEVNIPVLPNVEVKPSTSTASNVQGQGIGNTDEQNKKRKLDEDDSGGQVIALPMGPVPTNSTLSKHIDTVKPFIRGLLEHANLLKRWLTFLIPKVEDGNNFGVEIQEDTLNKIMTMELEADSFFNSISKYYISRGKIISEVAKYPHINDYRRHVVELDEKEFLHLRIILTKIRNYYASMYDVIGKNWEKITMPRSSNVENMY